MTELKPCPFCGGGTHYYAPAPIDHHIQCEKCFAETGGFSSKEEAIEAWNTRAERTCHPVSKSGEEFSFEDRSSTLTAWCSECHEYLGEACDVFSYHDRFCSGCGAKVVE